MTKEESNSSRQLARAIESERRSRTFYFNVAINKVVNHNVSGSVPKWGRGREGLLRG